MGTAGNRKGYKAYSINTTIRNPRRNEDFLKPLIDFEQAIFDSAAKFEYYKTLIKNGTYKFSNLPIEIKQKYLRGEELSPREIEELIKSNPQATSDQGRVTTQIRSLKDQGLIKFDGTKNKYKIAITSLGRDLLEHNKSGFDIYTKAMIAMHWGSTSRDTAYNKAIPFLNTLFVIRKVKQLWKEIEDKENGISIIEFGCFVLTMKDCDYERAANEIINYRKKFRYNINEDYLKNYIFDKLGLLKIDFNSLIVDYTDDVFRKFEMTGLITKRGNGRFIDININEIAKIESIYDYYSNYKWLEFENNDQYYSYIDSIKLPWEENIEIQNKIIASKLLEIDYKIDSTKTFEEISNDIDRLYYQKIFQNQDYEYSDEFLINELLMLSENNDSDSSFDSISQPVRLEWLIALLISNKFGNEGVNSNLIYDIDGIPISHAPGGMADIEIYKGKNHFLFEVTMIRNKNQQINSETTSIARHLKEYQEKNNVTASAVLIAPYIHYDTCRYYKYEANSGNLNMAPITINTFNSVISKSSSIDEFNNNLFLLFEKFRQAEIEEYMKYINS